MMYQGNTPLLFTPGPLSTSAKTKEAMLKDWGSWDKHFQVLTKSVLDNILNIAQAKKNHVCIPMQGSGTFSVEAALSTLLDRNKKILIPSNGAYCERIGLICDYLNVETIILPFEENEAFCPQKIEAALKADPLIDTVALVHCETSTGILNPIHEIAHCIKKLGRRCIIDAISTFGALNISAEDTPFDALIGSANKCLEGVPGMGFVLCDKKRLLACKGNATSLSLDLYAQWAYMEKTKQWRFTPPTHVVAALSEALDEYKTEGGQPARLQRYSDNQQTLVRGMTQLGFLPFLEKRDQSPIITTFLYPTDTAFDFQLFYDALHQKGFIIYPGKLTTANTFRIGSIGYLFEKDMLALLTAVEITLSEMKITMPTLLEKATC